MYAGEAGAIEQYVLMTASAGGTRQVPYEEAREYDEHRHKLIASLQQALAE
jgi:hypothetical protein